MKERSFAKYATFFAKDPFFTRIRSHQLDIETSKAFQQGPEVLRGAKAVGKKWKPFAKKGLKKIGIEKEMFCKKGNNMLPCGSYYLFLQRIYFSKEAGATSWTLKPAKVSSKALKSWGGPKQLEKSENPLQKRDWKRDVLQKR